MSGMKNIPKNERMTLASQIDYQPGQVVSKTLAQNNAVSLLPCFPSKRVRRSAPMSPAVMPWCRCWRALAALPWMATPTSCMRAKAS